MCYGRPAPYIADLDATAEIAERGPMPLYRAAILLTRARLFGLRNDTGGPNDLIAAMMS